MGRGLKVSHDTDIVSRLTGIDVRPAGNGVAPALEDEAAAADGRGEEAVVAGPGEVTVARRHELTVLVCEAAVHGEFGVSVCTPSLGVGREVGYKEERKVAVR